MKPDAVAGVRVTPPGEPVVRVPARWRIVLGRFAGSWGGRAGVVLLGGLFVLAFAGPVVGPWSYEDRDFLAFLQGPSWAHWFGTTQTGGDVFALTLRGMQKSLLIGLLVAVVSTGVAAVVGAFAGYYLGWTDRVLGWVTDLLLVLPAFLVIAVLSPAIGHGAWLVLVMLLAAFMWMVTSKVVRGMTISIKEREYVLAARFMGVPGYRIIFRHVLPNMASLLIVDATINVSAAILTETSLSYFGFGVRPPDVSLGGLIADGARTALYAPWTFWFAAGLLVLLVLAVNLIGDALRDAFDPTSDGRRR
ncbi:putative peptide transport permease protein [Acrocarpospora phusangensis]|uniref:Peptide transport permease protein n=2 Tax=Acrocarpospora phusangensis TaxID=1070424 RepID=A0A919QDD7_9ACTN|nr:ABC transporter permease [Acrocarpospora phusangensis]GIH24520.1 putative peptide transport permease protein [Acrocarpospora phusangensis]